MRTKNGKMHEGMTDRMPKPPKETPKGGSVNADATRSSPGKATNNIGPRTA
jgi:hypothetical protein